MPRRPNNRSGDYRDRVTFQEPVYTASDRGGSDITDYTDRGTVWASLRMLSTKERELAGQTIGVSTHQIAMYAHEVPTGVGLDWRIVGPSGERYNITGDVDNVQNRNMEARIMAKKIAAGAATRQTGGS